MGDIEPARHVGEVGIPGIVQGHSPSGTLVAGVAVVDGVRLTHRLLGRAAGHHGRVVRNREVVRDVGAGVEGVRAFVDEAPEILEVAALVAVDQASQQARVQAVDADVNHVFDARGRCGSPERHQSDEQERCEPPAAECGGLRRSERTTDGAVRDGCCGREICDLSQCFDTPIERSGWRIRTDWPAEDYHNSGAAGRAAGIGPGTSRCVGKIPYLDCIRGRWMRLSSVRSWEYSCASKNGLAGILHANRACCRHPVFENSRVGGGPS